jgi:GT2 family glycosyltransferase
MESPMTFCIGTCNNLNYLKLAIHSVRTYSYFKDAPLIIFAESCTDGTYEWLQTEGHKKYNLTVWMSYPIEKDVQGIGGGMNFCAKHVKTEYIMFLHADMFVSKNWDLNALNIFNKYPNVPMWVSSYRIQPNVFHEDSRPGTLVLPTETFGEYAENFKEIDFIEYAEEFSNSNDIEIRKGEGVSGLIRKKDWDFIGGNDPIFNPLSFDDMDLFIRMQKENYKFVLTTKSVVYHFGSRSKHGHFPTNNLTHRSENQINYEQRNLQRFIEKWGRPPQWDDVGFIKPITKI